MSGECNYCGGLHAEDGCDTDRDCVYNNGFAAGEAHGRNECGHAAFARDQQRVAEIERLRPFHDAIVALHNGYHGVGDKPATPAEALRQLIDEATSLGWNESRAEIERLRGERDRARDLADSLLTKQDKAISNSLARQITLRTMLTTAERERDELRAEVARLQNVIAERVGSDKEPNP